MKAPLTFLTATALALVAAQSLTAAVVYTENFDSATAGAVTNNILTTGSGLTWYSYGSGSSLSVTTATGGSGSGSLTGNSGGQSSRGVVGMFGTAQTLTNVGDSVRFDFQAYTTGTTANAAGFRFGLINKNGSVATLTSASTSFDFFKSYFTRIQTGATSGNTTVATDLTAETGANASILGGGDSSMTGSYSNLSGSAITVNPTITAFLGFEVKKLDATTLQVSLFQNTDATTFNTVAFYSGSIVISAIGVTSFDGLAIGTGITGSNSYTFDNVVVSSVSSVPEPSAYAALAGVAILGFVMVRRKPSNVTSRAV